MLWPEPNNAFLLLSDLIVTAQFLENLLPQKFLQQAAQIALVPDAQHIQFNITPGFINLGSDFSPSK